MKLIWKVRNYPLSPFGSDYLEVAVFGYLVFGRCNAIHWTSQHGCSFTGFLAHVLSRVGGRHSSADSILLLLLETSRVGIKPLTILSKTPPGTQHVLKKGFSVFFFHLCRWYLRQLEIYIEEMTVQNVSGNWWAATVATYCPDRMSQLPKLKRRFSLWSF